MNGSCICVQYICTSKNDFWSFNGIRDGIFTFPLMHFIQNDIQTPNRYTTVNENMANEQYNPYELNFSASKTKTEQNKTRRAAQQKHSLCSLMN